MLNNWSGPGEKTRVPPGTTAALPGRVRMMSMKRGSGIMIPVFP